MKYFALLFLFFVCILINCKGNELVEGNGSDTPSPSDNDSEDAKFLPKMGSQCPVSSENLTNNSCDKLGLKKDGRKMTAREACQEVQAQKTALGEVLGSFDHLVDTAASITPYGMINKAVDKLAGSSKVSSNMKTLLSTVSNTINSVDTQAKCNTTAQNLNQNSLTINQRECIDSLRDAVNDLKDVPGIDPTALTNLYNPNNFKVSIDGLNQTVDAKDSQKCAITSVQQALQKQAASVENTALQSALSDLAGPGEVQADTNMCTNISSEQNACTFINTSQCCSNVSQKVNQNKLDIKCGAAALKNINQTINSDGNQACALTNSATASTEQLSSASGSAVQDTRALGSQGAATIIAAIGGVLCVVAAMAAGGYYIYTENQDN